jgi:D-alanyl-D-alanine carboxypeptidase
MNQKAFELGMLDTKYEEPTGLSNLNRSTAIDLVKLIAYASQIPMVSHSSTLPSASFVLGKRLVNYHSTNRMVASGTWEIEAQKTGFISDAGQCLVMQAKVGGRRLGIVLLDGVGYLARTVDSERIRAWVEGRLDGLDQDSFVSAKTAADRFDYAPRDWDLPSQVVLQQEMSADDFARLSAGDLNEADTESVALEVINQEEGSDEISDEMSVMEAKSTQNAATKNVAKKDTTKLLVDSVPTNSTTVVSLHNNKHNLTAANSGAVAVKNLSAQAANQHLDGDAKKENNLIQKVKNVFLPAPVNVRPATSDKKMLQIQ